ncbi:rRNA-processing protein FCF1-like protein [Camelus ferus]|nr:rRNA-processing protein FCF1-like protein [Camelus ferus]
MGPVEDELSRGQGEEPKEKTVLLILSDVCQGSSSGLCPVLEWRREMLPEQGCAAQRSPSSAAQTGKGSTSRKPALDPPTERPRKEKDRLKPKKKEKKDPSALKEREVPQHPSCLFFQYNTQLGPPYHILVDTNFINFSIKAKLDLVQSMMDCLYAKCIPCITDCVMAEIEKLGQKYRVALSTADTNLYKTQRVDRDLKRRIRKIPGVPIMYISNHRYNIERMPDDYGAPRF